MRLKKIGFLVLFLMVSMTVRGQFYNTGSSPSYLRWNSIKTDSLEIIYPDYYEDNAYRVLDYLDNARKGISYGFDRLPAKTPVVLHTENFLSNGVAMLAPRRIEMVTIPNADSYSTHWLKHLAVHEYRHIVQYTNLNKGFTKVIGYIFGQQARFLAAGVMPFWWIEGDAVNMETQMTTYGRGLQPSFSMHYRAVVDEMLSDKNIDKWFSGSYKEFIPSHYELGYQFVSWTDRHYDEYIWDKIVDYGAKYPFFILTTELGLKKFYDTSTKKLFKNTFTSLNDFWGSLPPSHDNATKINTPITSYTTYRYPLFLNDSTIIAHKTDFDRAGRFVEIDINSGKEKLIAHTGIINSRATLFDGILYWTEYRQGRFWDQKVNSVLCSMNLESRKKNVDHDSKAMLFPTPKDGGFAYVRYNYSGSYTIVFDDGENIKEFDIPDYKSIHSLATSGDELYYIFVGHDGMGIEAINPSSGEVRTVKKSAFVTISDLRAADGKLYFGSIASGKDEVHVLDLESGREYRLSTSRYGAFMPSVSPDGKNITLTSYDKDGYKVAIMPQEPVEEIFYSHIPRNVVNPPRKKWDVPNIDTVKFTPAKLTAAKKKTPQKRFSKLGHLFNFHSWAPLYYNASDIMAGDISGIRFGLSAVSQNLLSSAITNVGYGYSFSGESIINANIKYNGFAPKLEFDATWRSSQAGYAMIIDSIRHTEKVGYLAMENGDFLFKATTPQAEFNKRQSSFRVYGRVSLPILLSSGYHTRYLSPSVEYQYDNLQLYNPKTESYGGQHLMISSLQYTHNVRRAYRDLQPRWGYGLSVRAGTRMLSGGSPVTWSIFGRCYLPGIMPHHHITLRGTYRNTVGSGAYPYALSFNELQPRGARTTPSSIDYRAFSVEYQMPIWYPEWGISGVFFIKRLRLSLFYDWAGYSTLAMTNRVNVEGLPQLVKLTNQLYSYGGTLTIDTSFLRLPAQGDLAIQLSVYAPNDRKSKWPVFAAGLSIPFF